MEHRSLRFVVKGMTRDLSNSKFDANFAYNNLNLRMTAREDGTLLSVTNELSTKELTIYSFDDLNTPITILGTIIGSNLLNNNLTLFTTDNSGTDRIYYITFLLGIPIAKILFQGNLNFRRTAPIETIGLYETSNIQKVYWVDGRNQPRFINIADISDEKIGTYTTTSFDFSRPINLDTFEADVEHEYNSGGLFTPGTILYAFAYHMLNGQLTPIFEFTTLHYISYRERGESAEGSVTKAFRIDFTGLDRSWDYLRVYAIQRSSLDAIPTVRIVEDLPIPSQPSEALFIVDTGLGDSVDPSLLLYVGGANIVASTMSLKDNTLFLGNLTLSTPVLGTLLVGGSNLKDVIRNYVTITTANRELTTTLEYAEGFYSSEINNARSSRNTRNFKSGETYRFGMIAQHETGEWSEVVWLGDYTNTYNPNITSFGGGYCYRVPRIRFTINSSAVVTALRNAGFIRVKPVIVSPELKDRTILCLGMLNPTVYNVEDRWNNNPWAQASWFARAEPLLGDNKNYPERTLYYNGSTELYMDISLAIPEFRHNRPLYSALYRSGEILFIYNPPNYPYDIDSDGNNMSRSTFVDNYKELWYVDLSVVTLNSPDIELSDELRSLSLEGVQCRIVAAIVVDNHQSAIDFTLSSAPSSIKGGKFPTLSKTKRVDIEGNSLTAGGIRVNSPEFIDKLFNESSDIMRSYPVYPWHRNGSLNTDNGTGETRTAVLDQKKLLNYRYSTFNYWLASPYLFYQEDTPSKPGITDVKIFAKDDTSTITLPARDNSNIGSILYAGNVDKIYPFNFTKVNAQRNTIDKSEGYPMYITGSRVDASGNTYPDIEYYQYTVAPGAIKGADPIRISYRSTPHAVFTINRLANNLLLLLPWYGTNNYGGNTDLMLFYGEIGTTTADLLSIPNSSSVRWSTDYQVIWLGELYREVTNRYGGTSDTAILNNRWIPSGNTSSLLGATSQLILNFDEGDTYLMRYDCLKTYAYSDTATNSIVDIVSFYCETRVNLNLRYDTNRGNTTNLVMSPSNFNLLNPVYNQSNNFFTYRALDYDRFSLNYFPNQIAWSSPKLAAEEIDSWANINLASTMDLDGDKGTIKSLQHLNNEIYSFLDRGIAHILYNSRVLIPSSEGVPIEIASSGAVLGKRYVSDMIGCQNKWSITKSSAGLYFIDNLQLSIYLFDGNSFDALSDRLGFKSWIGSVNSTTSWNPYNFYNYISYYDPTNGDIYFTGDGANNCLGYSESLGVFTSFYSYNNSPLMFSRLGLFYSFSSDNKMWEMFGGPDYLNLYGTLQDYSTTVVVNQDPLADKIYNTVEWRGEARLLDGTLSPTDNMFNYLQVDTEYQTTGLVDLTRALLKPSNLKRKFRIWRAIIPRSIEGKRMDRMRAPWAKVSLTNNSANKLEIHDITVGYQL